MLGTDGLYDYAEKYGIDIDPKLSQLLGFRPRQSWRKFTTEDNAQLITAEGLDLLGQLLRYDHAARPTAREAMAHSYFEPVHAARRAAGGAVWGLYAPAAQAAGGSSSSEPAAGQQQQQQLPRTAAVAAG